MGTRSLNLESIRLDGDTNPRAELDRDTIHDYAEKYKAGVKMPPLTVYFDGKAYWLVDGFHRWHAARKAKVEKFPCTVVKGNLDAARWASYSMNQAHGKPRNNEDKRRAVLSALRHPKAAAMTDVKIAEHVGVDDKTVARYRDEAAQATTLGNSECGKPGKKRRVDSRGRSCPAKKPRKKKPAAASPAATSPASAAPPPVAESESNDVDQAEAPADAADPKLAAEAAPGDGEPSFCRDLDALVEKHHKRHKTPWCIIASVLEHKTEWAKQQQD